MEKITNHYIIIVTGKTTAEKIKIKYSNSLRTDLEDYNINYYTNIDNYERYGDTYEDKYINFCTLSDQAKFLKYMINFLYND